MSGEGRDESQGGPGGADGGTDGGGPSARQVPGQGGPAGAGGPVGPPGVPGPAAEPGPADGTGPEADTNVPQQREGRGDPAPTAPLPKVPSPAQRQGSQSARTAATAAPPLADSDLVQRMREGDDSAYEELFRRHSVAVRRYARTCCRDADTADDLTAEVFARTLQAVRGGAGPEQAVRAYLLTTVRRAAAAWAKTAKREHLVEDFAVFAAQAAASSTVSDDDTLELGADVRAMHEAEQSLAMQAFRSLPERWQAVLWHTTIEEEPPSQVAPLFGLSANATAVLAGRAREGLKQAYLQAHVSSALTAGGDCARYADRLGAYARGGLRMRAERGLRKHLEECAKCRMAAGELASVNAQIPAVVPVAVIGWFATGFSLKALGIIGGAAAGAAGAGTAAAAGASSGAASGGAAGGAAAEGASTPLKVGAAALAAVAAAAGLVWALTSGDGKKAPPAEAKPPAAQPLVPQIPVPSHKPPAKPAPPAAPAPRAHTPHPAPPRPSQAPTPKPKPTTPPPAPSHTPPQPSPTPPKPTPTPPPPPPPSVFHVNQLRYGQFGDATDPRVRLGAAGFLWQRSGMSVGGTRYGYGVSMHAPSSVTIDLNRPCSTYRASVGVDDVTLGIGSLRFSVYGDGGRLWTSPVVRGRQAAVPVSVNVEGQKTIRLVVQPVTPFSAVAVADWADARIECG
ncbi:sigma-70 family RNA polymerase sigma factor [Streptomyces sp. NRRL F-5126]|uniref:sigma-70 family RNA polymerase sigma factor n=1 Tax=Streptomyces sp. NRRL F-5126 TaxID=1463857 RepID=UPI0004C4AE11|nr:sigma-70 family RNA polymerase sigma factor [Streptomyces sp. NRRL F-5126]